MSSRSVVAGMIFCLLVGCSAEGSRHEASSFASNDAAAATSAGPVSAPDGSSVVADTTTTVDAVGGTGVPVPELAEINQDGTVSWNFTTPSSNARARRFVLDPAPADFVVVDGGETPADAPAARALTGIFATGSYADPQITVTVSSPLVGQMPTLDGTGGEPVSVGEVRAVQRSLGVARVGLTFILKGYRVDVVAGVAVRDWLAPLAETVAINGSTVSARAPTGSALTFVGAFSPASPAAEGYDLIGLYYQSQATWIRYVKDDRVVVLNVSAGPVVNEDALRTWLEPRAEAIEVAGRSGWIVRAGDSVSVEWRVNGVDLQLGSNLSEEDLLALAASVRPATDDEWVDVSQVIGTK